LGHWNVLEPLLCQSDGRASKSQQQFKFYLAERSKYRTKTKEETKELLKVKILHEVPVGSFSFSKVINLRG